MVTRIAFASAIREATVTLLRECAAAYNVKLQVYPGRPATFYPPTAFIDSMTETFTPFTTFTFQRTPTVEVIVVHGLFDTLEAVTQRDDFLDAFYGWVADRWHAAGGETLIAPTVARDIPNYIPDWMPPERQRSYYATQITLEGFAAT